MPTINGKVLAKVIVERDRYPGENYGGKQEYIILLSDTGQLLRKESYKGHPNKGPYMNLVRGTVKQEIRETWTGDSDALNFLKEFIGRLKHPYTVLSVLIPKPQTEAEKDMPVFKTLTEKIQWESAQRRERYANFKKWVQEAHLAGMDAAGAKVPVPMIVAEHVNPLDDNSAIKKVWGPIDSGVCGYAWVSVYPGNSSFAHWAKKNAGFHSGRGSGMMGKCYLWVSQFAQSMERKEAYARAYAKVLRDHGIDAYSGSRMD